MAFSFQLSPRSPTNKVWSPLSPTEDQEWVADGIEDSETVKLLALQMSPGAVVTSQGILYRQSVKLNRQGHLLYYVTVTYSPKDRSKFNWSFDTTGGTFNIKTSRQHIASYVAAGEVAKDHKGAINRQLDGSVDGVDIVIPSMKINGTFTHPYGIVTLDFAAKMQDMTGFVNSKTFLRRKPGEVLFLGANGSDGTEAEATVGYSFAIEKELQNKLIGGITVVKKEGHDYAWVEFKNGEAANQPITKPRQIDVCRVYERIDLAAELGFGG
jgi:hypothetical protein